MARLLPMASGLGGGATGDLVAIGSEQPGLVLDRQLRERPDECVVAVGRWPVSADIGAELILELGEDAQVVDAALPVRVETTARRNR